MVLHNKTILVNKLMKRSKLVREHLVVIDNMVQFVDHDAFEIAFATTQMRALTDAKAACEEIQKHGRL